MNGRTQCGIRHHVKGLQRHDAFCFTYRGEPGGPPFLCISDSVCCFLKMKSGGGVGGGRYGFIWSLK